MSVMEGEYSSWSEMLIQQTQNCGKDVSVDERFRGNKPSVFYVFCTNKILVLKSRQRRKYISD